MGTASSERTKKLRRELVFDPEFEWMRDLVSFEHSRRAQPRPIFQMVKRGFERNVSYVHHWIIGKSDSLDVDHINGNTLDNRVSNLRLVSRSRNSFNKKRSPSFKNPYRCIYELSPGRFSVNVAKKRIGTFGSIEDAKQARKEAWGMVYGIDFVETCSNLDEVLCPELSRAQGEKK